MEYYNTIVPYCNILNESLAYELSKYNKLPLPFALLYLLISKSGKFLYEDSFYKNLYISYNREGLDIIHYSLPVDGQDLLWDIFIPRNPKKLFKHTTTNVNNYNINVDTELINNVTIKTILNEIITKQYENIPNVNFYIAPFLYYNRKKGLKVTVEFCYTKKAIIPPDENIYIFAYNSKDSKIKFKYYPESKRYTSFKSFINFILYEPEKTILVKNIEILPI